MPSCQRGPLHLYRQEAEGGQCTATWCTPGICRLVDGVPGGWSGMTGAVIPLFYEARFNYALQFIHALQWFRVYHFQVFNFLSLATEAPAAAVQVRGNLEVSVVS